jgi:hypothetical protein
MLRRILAGMALTGAALIPALSTTPAHAAAIEAAQPVVTASQCISGGGEVRFDITSPTLLRCFGGEFHGSPVIRGFDEG